MTRHLLIVAFAAATVGCSDRPRAPALTAEAVYEYDPAGLRFVPPAGWYMTARADPPGGGIPKPQLLVRYQNPKPDSSGSMEVYGADLPAGVEVGEFLLKNMGGGGETWVLGKSEPPIKIGGADARRYTYTAAHPKKGALAREVVVFPRGGPRAYYFVTTVKAADGTVRDQVRASIDGIVWSGG